MIILKTQNELKILREANRMIAIILAELEPMIKPGASTYELDQWAEKRIYELNGVPGFKGYGGPTRLKSFPATLCTSINDEVVHGIPRQDRILQEGDIIGVDVGIIYQGYFGDGARTYPVGTISEAAIDLLDCCQKALYEGIDQARNGNRVNDISIAIDRFVRSRGYEIVRDLTGHGIGRNLHEEPQILNYDDGTKKQKLKENMTLAIEPMITNGGYEVKTLPDDWTVVTADGSLSAHFEHTIAITANGPEILTRI